MFIGDQSDPPGQSSPGTPGRYSIKWDYATHFSTEEVISTIPFKNSSFHAEYKLGGVLGTGLHSTIRKITNRKTKENRAQKLIDKRRVKDSEEKQLIVNEVFYLKLLDHPNVLKVHEAYQDPLYVHLVMEMYTAGDLFDQIIQIGSFSEKKACDIIQQLLETINYAQKRNLVHRDIKPENILLDVLPDGSLVSKLINWGSAVSIQEGDQLQKQIGTPLFMAPEMIRKRYDMRCDIWSIGVIMYILLSGKSPFIGKTLDEIYESVTNGAPDYTSENWEAVSQNAKDLVKNLLKTHPDHRFTTYEALKHPWFKAWNSKEGILQTGIFEKNFENLKKFRAEQKFKQATFSYITQNLMEKEQKQQLIDIFTALDTNGDGVLSKYEIVSGLERLMGVEAAKEEAAKIFRQVDLDNSGYLDYAEFTLACVDHKQCLSEEKLRQAFEHFDKDGNGSISIQEIEEGLAGIENSGDINWEEIMKDVDRDGDGEVSFEEFKMMMMKLS